MLDALDVLLNPTTVTADEVSALDMDAIFPEDAPKEEATAAAPSAPPVE